ncbi:HAD family hydrolase [Candidatus Saccharibacteria bacterium]|nr:HAD family hydrolase [Candidatus Saccharibacteria bacterium]
MISLSDVAGVIFDLDDTLLDVGNHENHLHAVSRLQALREAGKRHSLPALLAITPEENYRGFLEAPVHSLEWGVWHILFRAGVVPDSNLDPTHPLLLEIAKRKEELYEAVLREHGKPVAGAVEFIEWLTENGLDGRLAIASTAARSQITIFLDELTGLRCHFPEERVIAKDSVTKHKPDPEAFDMAFRKLNLPESARTRTLAFEDNPLGIAAAKGAGLFTCAITSVHSREELAALDIAPDLIADSFDEFRQILAEAAVTA